MNILYDYSHILSAVLAVVKDGLQKSSPAQKVMDDTIQMTTRDLS